MAAVVCGVLVASCSGDDASEAQPDERSTTTTTEPRFTGDRGSPFCTRLRELDLSGPATQSEDAADVEAAFASLVGLLDELGGLAPEDVRPDVELVAEGISALDEALAVVEYDWDALAASPQASAVAAATNDPAFTVAGDRLAAYRTQVCGLGG